MEYTIHSVGDKVYIVDVDGYLRYGTIKRQEWWESNPNHPVYYDIGDDADEFIACSAAPNTHYDEVFMTAEEAIRNYNIFSTRRVKLSKVNRSKERVASKRRLRQQ